MKTNKIIYTLLSFGMILGVWKILTFHFSPMVVPPIPKVFEALINIFTDARMHQMIGLTIQRLVIGLILGVLIGLILGILMGTFKIIQNLFSPIISLFHTIPPVTWVVLALVWFGFNGKPTIFIVTISTIPIMAINIMEGISNLDKRLIEMAEIFHFSKKKRLIHVTLPSIAPYFKTAFKVVLGSGWKIAVMGEVLTTTDGIGGMIRTARVNIETEYVIAWAIVIVLLHTLSDLILSKLLFRQEQASC